MSTAASRISTEERVYKRGLAFELGVVCGRCATVVPAEPLPETCLRCGHSLAFLEAHGADESDGAGLIADLSRDERRKSRSNPGSTKESSSRALGPDTDPSCADFEELPMDQAKY